MKYLQRTTIYSGIAIAVVTMPILSATARADDGLIWQYSQYNDENDRGRTVSILQFAIPETDAVAVFGSCRAGSSGNFSKVTFGADAQGLPSGANVDVRFKSGKFRQIMQGNVSSNEIEEGVSGVDFVIDNDDPLWDALKRGSQVRYSVNGKSNVLSLRGSRAPIEDFLADCKIYAGNGADASFDEDNEENRTPDLSDPRYATCENPRLQQSDNSGQAVTVTFVNQTEGHRAVMWMDFDGNPVDYAGLNPGESFKVNTNSSHPWMFTDGPGNCLEMYMPKIGEGVFNITAPNY